MSHEAADTAPHSPATPGAPIADSRAQVPGPRPSLVPSVLAAAAAAAAFLTGVLTEHAGVALPSMVALAFALSAVSHADARRHAARTAANGPHPATSPEPRPARRRCSAGLLILAGVVFLGLLGAAAVGGFVLWLLVGGPMWGL